MSDFFVPTNSSDTEKTNLEYELWMKEQDKRKDDFPYIALSWKEKCFLRRLNRDYIKITGCNRQIALRLRALDLIFIHKNDSPNSEIKEFAVPRYRGVNYLAYIKEGSKQTNSSFSREIILTIVGGFAWHPIIEKVIEFIKSLFEK